MDRTYDFDPGATFFLFGSWDHNKVMTLIKEIQAARVRYTNNPINLVIECYEDHDDSALELYDFLKYFLGNQMLRVVALGDLDEKLIPILLLGNERFITPRTTINASGCEKQVREMIGKDKGSEVQKKFDDYTGVFEPEMALEFGIATAVLE